MASLVLSERADYLVHDSYTIETEDHEDHTFNGVMFDIEALATRPVDRVVVDAVHVRGQLGPMTVWWTKGGMAGREERPEAWNCCFRAMVAPSWRDFKPLKLEPPILLEPGCAYGIYVHSARPDDYGLFYDNAREDVLHEDDYVRVFSGKAHLNPEPFCGRSPWGHGWGRAWRDNRALVGKLSYGARFVLWRPPMHRAFNPAFRRGCGAAFYALTMGWNGLPTDCVLYILHLARFDWFDLPEEAAPALPPPEPETEEVLAARHVALQTRYTSDYSRFDHISDSESSDSDYGT